tara:strand:- start:20 stop:436 length:417 start_codon:yes stop_codon:yes gene_type:complete
LKRILGLDHGDRRIGLALSDPLQIIAKPFETIDLKFAKNIFDLLNSIIKEQNVEKIIVGYPITLKNKFSIQTKKVLKFVELLKKNVQIEVKLYDERLTSQIAQKSLIMQGVKTGHNKDDVDKTAAAVFLQNYLDENKK